MKSAKVIKINNQNVFFDKEIFLPTSKSYLNRVLILAVLQKTNTIIYNVNDICADVEDMISALIKLGIKIEIRKHGKKNDIIIYGNGGKFIKPHDGKINCGLGGTTARFLLALSSLFDFKIEITAEGRMLERPIDEILNFLKKTGKQIIFLQQTGCLPIKIDGKLKSVKKLEVNGDKSSQFLSAILMVADQIGLDEIVVKNLVSKSYVKMTLGLLRKFGIIFSKLLLCNQVVYKRNTSCKVNVCVNRRIKAEEDWSAASYFLALQFMFDVKQKLLNLTNKSLQGDAKFFEILKKIEKHGAKNLKKMLILNMKDMPDTSMTAMIVCCLQDFNTKITGLETLKNKECNRLFAMQNEFAKIGIKSKISDAYDAITIYGNSKIKLDKNIFIETYNDHRIAMCFAILGCKLGNIVINNSDVVNKSFPNFWNELGKFCCIEFDKTIL